MLFYSTKKIKHHTNGKKTTTEKLMPRPNKKILNKIIICNPVPCGHTRGRTCQDS